MLLDVMNVSSGYGKMTIVRGVDMAVRKDEIVVIIGPNGSGKSTLMKTIFGIIQPMKGEVVLDGKNISGLRPDRIVREGINYVPQLDNVFPSLTVTENLEMGAYTLKDCEDRLQTVMEIFPLLKEKKDAKAIRLSGGERQTVAVARGLMTDPKLLLLDEPTAGLSPALVSHIMAKIQEIRDNGTSVLLVEQNAKKSLAICDRAYVMVMGAKAYEGSGQEILDHEHIGRLYLGKESKA